MTGTLSTVLAESLMLVARGWATAPATTVMATHANQNPHRGPGRWASAYSSRSSTYIALSVSEAHKCWNVSAVNARLLLPLTSRTCLQNICHGIWRLTARLPVVYLYFAYLLRHGQGFFSHPVITQADCDYDPVHRISDPVPG